MLDVNPSRRVLPGRILLLLTLTILAALAFGAKEGALEKGFRNPPRSVQPKVYWWWLYNRVDKAGITRDLEQFHKKGISGVNLICTGGYAGLEPLPGVPFLGPEWRELFRHAVKEAKRFKIDLGFNLAGGWVMIGPWVTPDLAMKKVVQTEVKFTGPGRYAAKLPQPETVNDYYRDVWVQAFKGDASEVVDLSTHLGKDGIFRWDVPAGEWTILRTGYTMTGSRWGAYPEGDTFKGGEGFQIDYLSTAALDDHFSHLGNLVLDEAKQAGGKLAFLWSDSWECGKLTWTQDFPAQFKRFRGYDLKPYMPALAGHTVVNADVTARFLADYDRTIQDCLAENFYGHFADLSHRNGTLMGNEAAGPGDIPPMDSLRNLGRCDIPTGEFWAGGQYRFPGGFNLNLKQTASAAHTYGKKVAMAEAFTQQDDRTHWNYGPEDLKPLGDRAFCEGINLFMLHCAVCQLSTDGKPGYEFCAGQHWDTNITWWEQIGPFLKYLARCQYLLQQGRFVADVCFYLGEEPPIIAPPKHANPALGWGYDADYCNAEVLLKRMSVKSGRIALPDGMSYRLLVLQNCTSPVKRIADQVGGTLGLRVPSTPSVTMSPEVAQKVRELVRAGATVIGAKPEKAVGLTGYPQSDAVVRAIADEVWGDCDGVSVKEHRFGKGRVIWGKTPKEVLTEAGIGPDFTSGSPIPLSMHSGGSNKGVAGGESGLERGQGVRGGTAEAESVSLPDAPDLDYVHRSVGDADIYFVANLSDESKARECSFRVTGKTPEIWDPVTGEMRPVTASAQGDRTSVSMEFAPHQSLFVVFQKALAGAPEAGSPLSLAPVQKIEGPWAVSFDPAWGGPASVEFKDLVSWIKRPELGIKFYSGKATYQKTFDLPSKGDRLFLDLGNVRHVAEVRLNGKKLGILWTSPWRVEITEAVKAGANKLEVDVINLWANRVIGDLALPVKERLTTTHDGFRFDMITKNSPLLDSGLLGPVTVLKAK
jgi:hypothetical protein